MKDLAYKIIGMDTLWDEAIECDDMETGMELELEIALNAGRLARLVLELPDNPATESHTRLDEVRRYAHIKQVCVEHAIVELVNTALSDGALVRLMKEV